MNISNRLELSVIPKNGTSLFSFLMSGTATQMVIPMQVTCRG